VNANTGGVACQRCGEGGEGGVAVRSGQRPAALIAECDVRIETEIPFVVNPFVKGIVESAKNAFSLKHTFPFDINNRTCGHFRTQWEGGNTIGLEGARMRKTPILV